MKMTYMRYQIERTISGLLTFRVIDKDEITIAYGDEYESLEDCEKAIEQLKLYASRAYIQKDRDV